jgi:hypothetical protein
LDRAAQLHRQSVPVRGRAVAGGGIARRAELAALVSGELEPATGFMMGKFKVSGDMSVAMKLQRIV